MDSTQSVIGFRLCKASGGRTVPDELKDLLLAVEALLVSTADCKRSSSVMNRLLTKIRNRIQVTNLSSMMFLDILGSSVKNFEPRSYVQKWLQRGPHAAYERASRKREVSLGKDASPYSHSTNSFNRSIVGVC